MRDARRGIDMNSEFKEPICVDFALDDRIGELLDVLRDKYPRSRELWDKAYRAAMDDTERALRDCLGRWVSELEPVAVYDESRAFLGLAVAGVPGRVSIIVPNK